MNLYYSSMLILYLVVNIIVLCFSDKCMYYNFVQITYHKQKNNVHQTIFYVVP